MSKKLIKVKKPKKNSLTVYYKISPEIQRKNRHVRQMKALSNKDFVINLLEKIISEQKHNKLTLNRNETKIGFYNLGVENDDGDVAKTIYYLHELKKQHRIEGYNYDGVNYIIINPDVKKLQDYINDFNGYDCGSISGVATKAAGRKNPIIELPAGAVWNDITIKFKNDWDVEIFVKKLLIKSTNNEELKFYSGKKNKKPDFQWQFLYVLSAIVGINNGLNESEATVEKMSASLSGILHKNIKKNTCEKIKSKLSEKLRGCFGLDGEPFHDYKEFGYYKPVFELKPIPGLRGDGEPFMTKRNSFNEAMECHEVENED